MDLYVYKVLYVYNDPWGFSRRIWLKCTFFALLHAHPQPHTHTHTFSCVCKVDLWSCFSWWRARAHNWSTVGVQHSWGGHIALLLTHIEWWCSCPTLLSMWTAAMHMLFVRACGTQQQWGSGSQGYGYQRLMLMTWAEEAFCWWSVTQLAWLTALGHREVELLHCGLHPQNHWHGHDWLRVCQF
jgi:hypothetical protein